jgi:hypothetical protein
MVGGTRWFVGSVVAIACALAGAGAASAATRPGTTVERGIRSEAPDAKSVRASYVRVYDPLPASVGPHPSACDWLAYLRFRDPKGPRESARADAVVVLIPGFLAGGSSFDVLARNAVLNSAARGSHVEVWGLDRRANCLEDHTGVEAASRARDASVAYDYYWRGGEAGGRRFDGFKSGSEADFLREFGLERTVRDWYTVLTRAVPDRRQRVKKVICGGHSLGGPLTAAFASWDFDGDPDTIDDAGYNQCAGLVGLDTSVAIDGSSGAPGGASAFDVAGQNRAAPFIDAPPLTPETIQLPSVFGVGAFHRARGTDLLRKLPHSNNIDLAQRLLFSRDAANFVTGRPSIRDFTVTNEVVLSGVFDDNSAPIFFLRASLGFATGGPVVDKNFPGPSGGFLAIPSEPKTPLYSWRNYDEVRPPIALNDDGEPFTTREGEVTDIHQLARAMFEAPADYVEQYFPTRILTDVTAAEEGDRSGSLSNLRYDGPSKRPLLLIQARDSDNNDPDDRGPPIAGERPNGLALSREWILPGYNHLDVAAAARRQNDGRPEPSSGSLTDFVFDVVRPPAAMRLSVRPRRVRRGRRVRLRYRVTSKSPSCRGGVVVRIGNRRVRTSSRGRAALRIRLGRTGVRRVRARKAGCHSTKTRLRVKQRRRR